MNHPLHRAVADAIQSCLDGGAELFRDPACGGTQQLPLFIGPDKARDTRMCCADLLFVSSCQVRAIIEIEESGFLPTKICGKFFQAVLADHFIHDTLPSALPYAPPVAFIQVLDSSRWPKRNSHKFAQAEYIKSSIQKMLPLRRIFGYDLFIVRGPDDRASLDAVAAGVAGRLNQPKS